VGPESRFIGRVSLGDVRELPDEYRELLERQLSIAADSELGLAGLLEPRWIFSAPTADEGYRLAHIIANEIDHFREFNRLLNELGVDRSDLVHRPKEERLRRVFRADDVHAWADVLCICALVGRAGKLQLEDMVGSSYRPLDEVLPHILDVKATQLGFGTARLGQLAASRESHADAQAVVNRWYPRALACIGRVDSPWTDGYVAWGLRRRRNEEVRQAFTAELSTVLTRIGLILPN
jgi:ring-1,2-phenylacetyl-CoA epoxidase subunit PaaA